MDNKVSEEPMLSRNPIASFKGIPSLNSYLFTLCLKQIYDFDEGYLDRYLPLIAMERVEKARFIRVAIRNLLDLSYYWY